MTIQIDPRIDHYKVLGVKSKASGEDIKKAYRRLAKKYHPDSTGGDKAKEDKFKKISHAYDILGDKDKRAQYDAMRSGAGAFRGGGFGGGYRGGGFSGADLGQIFSQMFQGAAGGGGRQGNVNMRFNRGGGSPFAGGFGGGVQGQRAQAKATPPRERKIKLSDGSSAMLRGFDVHADLRIPLDQAILGTVVEVATMTGKGKVKVPAGTSSGLKLRLKGKGARQRDGTHGHHYATVHIDVPKEIDEKAKQLLVKFMQRTKR